MVDSSQTDPPGVTDPRTWESTHPILDPIRPHRLAGLNLFIEQVPPGTPTPPQPPHLGLEHTGVAVTSIDAVCAELKARGAEFVVEPHTSRPGLRVAFVRAPENVHIELLERSINTNPR